MKLNFTLTRPSRDGELALNEHLSTLGTAETRGQRVHGWTVHPRLIFISKVGRFQPWWEKHAGLHPGLAMMLARVFSGLARMLAKVFSGLAMTLARVFSSGRCSQVLEGLCGGKLPPYFLLLAFSHVYANRLASAVTQQLFHGGPNIFRNKLVI